MNDHTHLTAQDLRARQAPLKDAYRADPSSAITELTAQASWHDTGITATVQTWAGDVRAGLHSATGGDGSDACSGDMLLQALLACAGVTLRSVATAMSVPISNAQLSATSHFDARGTLGIDRQAPVGLGPVDVVAELDTDADDATVEKLGQLTERYCVVGQSLNVPVRIVTKRTRSEPGQSERD